MYAAAARITILVVLPNFCPAEPTSHDFCRLMSFDVVGRVSEESHGRFAMNISLQLVRGIFSWYCYLQIKLSLCAYYSRCNSHNMFDGTFNIRALVFARKKLHIARNYCLFVKFSLT